MSLEEPRFGPEQYTAGTTIFHQNDVSDKFYIITNGVVDIIRMKPEGEEIVNQLGPGQFFGEIGLMNQSRRLATVRAHTDVELMSMDRQTFVSWINTSVLVQDEIKEVIGRRLRQSPRFQVLSPETADSPDTPKDVPPQVKSEPVPSSTDTFIGPIQLSFPPQTTIIHEGDPADKFYMILDGFVEVIRKDLEGHDILISRLTSGDYFGEIGLLEHRQRTATVRTISEVKVVAFDRDSFRSWMSKSPDSQDDIKHTVQQRLTHDAHFQLPESDE